MQILCGVDIIEIDRVKKAIETTGDAFTHRVYTMSEISYCKARGAVCYSSFAARFAAKEAVSKALGTGFSGGIGWKDIEILTNSAGCPQVLLHCKAMQKFLDLSGTSISISLSHCDSYAVAYAVIQTN